MRAWWWAALVACDGGATDPSDTSEPRWQPEVACPSDQSPDCTPTDDTSLRAAAAVRSIVPACYETWTDLDGDAYWDEISEDFADCGCDHTCPGDPGYTAADEGEGDGEFQAVWIGGFQNKRAMTGVRGADRGMIGAGDSLDARVLLLEQGNMRLAIVTLDSIGYMYDQVLEIRQAVSALNLGVDHALVASSHSHSAPDTMGIWGPGFTKTGFSQRYADQVSAAVAEAVTEAAAGLEPVQLALGEVDANTYADNGVGNLIKDDRDPFIVDPRIGVIHLTAQAEPTRTVATVVHWADHPETIADENTLLTADFIHGIRRTVTQGSSWPGGMTRAGIGGVTLYVNGTVGGMMSSLHASIVDPEGNTWRDHSWNKVDALGQLVGEMALDAVAAATPVTAPKLSFGAQTFELPVDNFAYQAMFLTGVFDHRTAVGYDPEENIDEDNRPEIPTEVDIIELGPLRMVSVPGELLPEGAIGGYDGGFTPPGAELVRSDNPNPPKLDQAPTGPYLWDRLGGEQRWFIGLGNDEVGYIIPPYNFELADGGAWFLEAEGDHYEETNSLGPDTLPIVEAEVDRLIGWLNGD